MSGGNKGVSSSSSSAAASTIPAASRKMVLSLKEIVSYSEQEIYAMLKECNMDPNETVDRLLSQDRFHEVKSKREKKKENKDTTEFRSRGASNTANRGGRGGTDRYVGRGGSSSTQFSSTEPGAFHGKSVYKKENGTYAHTNPSSSAPRVIGNNVNHQQLSLSESIPKENKMSTRGGGDGTFSASQSSGFQPAWVGVPGQVSMADIVKMGRPHGMASSTMNQSHLSVHDRGLPSSTMNQSHLSVHDHLMAPPSAASHQGWHSSQDYASNLLEEPGVVTNRHVPPNDEWPLVEQPLAAGMSSVVEEPLDFDKYADSSTLPFVRTNQNLELQIDEAQLQEDGAGENSNANFVRSGSSSSRSVQEDNDMYSNMNSYQHHRHAFEHEEVEDGGASLSSVAANLQQLSLQKDERGALSEQDDHSVVIPNHLQAQSADCAHLSFGSFRSGNSAGFSAPFTSRPMKSDVEEASTVADASSVGHSDTRNPEYYGDEHLLTTSDGNVVHRTSASTESYDSHSVSQPEVLKQDIPEAGQGNQYVFPSSAPGYTFENIQQLNAAYAHSSSQMQNSGPFSSVLQAYTNSLPSTLLASTVQPVRESDLPYAPFPVSQSMPTKYNNAASSISGSTISMPEGLKTGNLSAPQPTQQTLPGGNVATGPALPQGPQHLAVHPYSQPTLPLGHFANMIGYPFLPQSYTYMPSAFQQAFGGNSSYHQSLAPVLPQYKNNVSVSSLPQSAAIASGYGAFGSSTNVPGNFPLNPPAAAAAAGTSIGYDDIISSHYKDASQLLSLQQSDNPAMWVHGPGSRTMSAVPASTYYSFQGQNQQPAGFRQGQQPSQHFGAHGYPNFYHSQTGMSLEHQQQNPRDGSLSGSQGQPSKQSQQIWQNNY